MTYIDGKTFFHVHLKEIKNHLRTLKTKELYVYPPVSKAIQSSSAILFIGEKTCSCLEKILPKWISLVERRTSLSFKAV